MITYSEANENWHYNWERVFDLIPNDSMTMNGLRNCARTEAQREGWDQGTSDINHIIYERIQRCENKSEIMRVMVSWAREQGLL